MGASTAIDSLTPLMFKVISRIIKYRRSKNLESMVFYRQIAEQGVNTRSYRNGNGKYVIDNQCAP